MWTNPLTKKSLDVLSMELGIVIIDPVVKLLACKDYGSGALASVDTIINTVYEQLVIYFNDDDDIVVNEQEDENVEEQT